MSRLTTDEDGLVLTSSGGEEIGRLKWDDVYRIEAYKTDAVTVDQICLDFETTEGIVTITEDDEGFHEIPGLLLTLYDVADLDWYEAVMKPAFEPKRTLVYDRDMDEGPSGL